MSTTYASTTTSTAKETDFAAENVKSRPRRWVGLPFGRDGPTDEPEAKLDTPRHRILMALADTDAPVSRRWNHVRATARLATVAADPRRLEPRRSRRPHSKAARLRPNAAAQSSPRPETTYHPIYQRDLRAAEYDSGARQLPLNSETRNSSDRGFDQMSVSVVAGPATKISRTFHANTDS